VATKEPSEGESRVSMRPRSRMHVGSVDDIRQPKGPAMLPFRSLRAIAVLVAVAGAAFGVSAWAQINSVDTGQRITWESALCVGSPLKCSKLTGVGYLFTPQGVAKAKAVVIVSHGAQGMDKNQFNYVDALLAEGFAALVIDYYSPRGIRRTADDYSKGNETGGNVLNMNFDALTAAEALRKTYGFAKIGYIGESYGAGAALSINKKFAQEFVTTRIRGTYSKWFSATPVDSIVALYPFCGVRDDRDRYPSTPFLLIIGDSDDATPAPLCERYVKWMNERGGDAHITILPGEGHNFDFNHRRGFAPKNPTTASCDVLVHSEGRVEDVAHGTWSSDVASALAQCTTRGYHGGNTGNQFVAVPMWIEHFKKTLLESN
jgi:dienelactone hydrolase